MDMQQGGSDQLIKKKKVDQTLNVGGYKDPDTPIYYLYIDEPERGKWCGIRLAQNASGETDR